MPDLYSEGFAAGKAAGENNRHSLETTNVRLTNELRSIKFERTRERDLFQQELAEARAERDDAVATVKLLTEQHRIQVDHDGRLIGAAEALARQQAEEIGKLREAADNISPYLRWTIGDESPGHHPTMRSAVAAFHCAFDIDTEEKRAARLRAALSKEEQP